MKLHTYVSVGQITNLIAIPLVLLCYNSLNVSEPQSFMVFTNALNRTDQLVIEQQSGIRYVLLQTCFLVHPHK